MNSTPASETPLFGAALGSRSARPITFLVALARQQLAGTNPGAKILIVPAAQLRDRFGQS
jgi:hypothetical protein